MLFTKWLFDPYYPYLDPVMVMLPTLSAEEVEPSPVQQVCVCVYARYIFAAGQNQRIGIHGYLIKAGKVTKRESQKNSCVRD